MRADRDDPAVAARRLRAFARRLAGPGRADDLVQEALATALARGAPLAGPYLFGVLRNLAREDARASLRRRAREARASRPARVASTLASALARERARVVAAAVDALPERARRTLRLRYYEGLPAAEIARREGVPTSTVRNRVRRALARLRAELERAFRGDPRRSPAWLLPRRRWRVPAAVAVAALFAFAAPGRAHAAPPPPPEAAPPSEVPRPSEQPPQAPPDVEL